MNLHKISQWAFDQALPHWCDQGIDRTGGGFVERLRLDGTPDPVDFKRLRVQARQIYVFSHASLIDPNPDRGSKWREAARFGFEFMTDRYWLGQERGWAQTVTPDGAPRDTATDTYDQAFVLFAAAWHYRASRDPGALEVARKTLDFLDNRLACDAYGGYLEGLDEQGRLLSGPPRLQNPHMHLLEAMLALYQATGQGEYLTRGAAIMDLFRNRFFDPKTGSLGEYFTRDWQPADGPRGQIVEPGHHFEWSWILHNYATASGDETARDIARAVFLFARDHGLSRKTSLAFDEVNRRGQPTRKSNRLWPQTETLKAFISDAEFAPDPDARAAAEARILPMAEAIFRYYFTLVPGIWNDQLDESGASVSTFVPATSLYHLFLAFAETMRFYGENRSS